MFNIDVSRIQYGTEMYAVHCITKEEADEFIRYMFENHRDKTANWSESDSQWDKYREATCYSPCLNGNGQQNRLLYYYMDWFVKNGYKIIEFSDLCANDVQDIGIDEFSTLFI